MVVLEPPEPEPEPDLDDLVVVSVVLPEVLPEGFGELVDDVEWVPDTTDEDLAEDGGVDVAGAPSPGSAPVDFAPAKTLVVCAVPRAGFEVAAA